MAKINTPTPENVLPKYKNIISAVSKIHKKHKAIVSIWGLSRCPWCDSKMIEGPNYIATCTKDSSHIVEWLPWPG